MVVALRDQAPKKSRLSLFRLGKSSTKPAASRVDASTPRSYPDPPSLPRHSHNDGARAERQSASEGATPAVIAVHYQYPTSTNLPGGYDWPATLDSHADDHRRMRADSLPMQTMYAERDVTRAGKHSRQRSHFSIPDVIVTSCDDDEQHVVELHVPPNKRRSYVLRDLNEAPAQRSKPSAPHTRRPEPLIRFDSNEMRTTTRTTSVPSLASRTADSASSTPTSSASSSLSKGSGKRMRKASFPSLFSRKSLDSSRVEEPMPITPVTPSSAPAAATAFDGRQPDGLLFSAHSSATPLPSPPATPTSPAPKLSKKELKARQKAELALIRDVERIDRLVKQHDSKARKAQQKHEAKQRKRAEKLAHANAEFHPTPPPPPAAAGRTIFQAATRAAPALGRRGSMRGFVGERRGSEPTIPSANVEVRAAATPFSMDLPSTARMPFAEPRAAPRPMVADAFKPAVKAPLGMVPRGQSVSPPRPLRPAPPPPVQDEPRRQAASWDDLTFAAPLPSLIASSSGNVGQANAGEEEDCVVELDEAARRARRASVQRVLALSDEGGRLQKRASLRKRTSAQALKRRSDDDTARNADKRTSLIPRVGADKGWMLDEAAPDDSTVVQLDAREWIEDDPDSHGLLEQQGEVDKVLAHLHAAQEDHLRRQEATDQVANDSPSRPKRSARRQEPRSESLDSSDSSATAITDTSTTEEVVCFSRPFSPNQTDKHTAQEKGFTLELTLSPLQPLDIFTTNTHV